MPTELNVADDCSRVIKHNMLTNKHQWIAGPAFLVQQDIDIKIDVGIFGISQDLNFQSNVTINNYSKETSKLKQKPEKQPHCSISANWEYYSSFSKIVGHSMDSKT